MGLCSSKKSLKVVHPLDVVPTDGTTAAAPASAAVEPAATPAPAAPAPAPVTTPAPAVPKAVAKAKAKAKAKPTSLIKAIKVNDVTVVEEFLQAPDCNLEVLGMWDNTPLLAACMYGHSEVALKLLARGANVFAQNEHGATALHYSSVEGSLEVTKAILDSASEVEKLVNSGAAKVYNRHLDCYGERTPLTAAAESGFEDSVALLLAAGARLDEADEDGRTALWLAARHSRLGVSQVLLKHGADATHRDKEGTSVLGAATAGRCNDDLVLALLAVNGLDVNKTSGSPLFDVVKANKKFLAETLLTHGAAVNTPGPGGRTALHAACERGDEYLVQLLVRSRADTSMADAQGFTAFDLLRRRGLPDGKILAMFNLPAQSESDGGTGSAADG